MNFDCVQFPFICVLLLFVSNDILKFVTEPNRTLYSLLVDIIPLIYLVVMLSFSLWNPPEITTNNVTQAGIGDWLNVKGWNGCSDQEKRTVINSAGATWAKIGESLPRISPENSWRGKAVVSVFVMAEVLNRTLLDPVEPDKGAQ